MAFLIEPLARHDMQFLNDSQAELVTGGAKARPRALIRSLSINNVLVIAPQINVALVLGQGSIKQGNGVGVGVG